MLISSIDTAVNRGGVTTIDGVVRQYHLVDSARDRADGHIDLFDLADGAECVIGFEGAESAIVVIDGGGAIVGDSQQAIARGTVIQQSVGGVVHLRAAAVGLRALVVVGLPTTADGNGASSFSSRVAQIQQVIDNPFHNPEQGFHHMSARWLVDSESGGSRTFTLGQSTFAPALGSHELHRHPGAQEFFYIMEGHGSQLDSDGREVSMSAGDLAFVPRNEWHGFRNTGSIAVLAIFGYLGVESLEAGGYELP